eukprot:164363_1
MYFAHGISLASRRTHQDYNDMVVQLTHLSQAAQKGNFFEMREWRHHHGKVFTASDQITTTDESKSFPSSFSVCRLSDGYASSIKDILGCHSKPRLVAVSFKSVGSDMLPSWTKPFTELMGGTLVIVNFVESVILGLMKGAMMSGMRKSLDPSAHQYTWVHFGNATPLLECDFLHISNRLSCYVYLVDSSGLVRWAGCGQASDLEIESLKKCYSELMLEEKNRRTTKNTVRLLEEQIPT